MQQQSTPRTEHEKAPPLSREDGLRAAGRCLVVTNTDDPGYVTGRVAREHCGRPLARRVSVQTDTDKATGQAIRRTVAYCDACAARVLAEREDAIDQGPAARRTVISQVSATRDGSRPGYGYSVERDEYDRIILRRQTAGHVATTYHGSRVGDALDAGEFWADQMRRGHTNEIGYACQACSAIAAVAHLSRPIHVRQGAPVTVSDYERARAQHHPRPAPVTVTYEAEIAATLDDGSREPIGRVRWHGEPPDGSPDDRAALEAEAIDLASASRDLDHAPEDLIVTALRMNGRPAVIAGGSGPIPCVACGGPTCDDCHGCPQCHPDGACDCTPPDPDDERDALISDAIAIVEGCWSQGALHVIRDTDEPTTADDPNATHCALGGMEAAAIDRGLDIASSVTYAAALDKIADAIADQFPGRLFSNDPATILTDFNDHQDTTEADVLRVLRTAHAGPPPAPTADRPRPGYRVQSAIHWARVSRAEGNDALARNWIIDAARGLAGRPGIHHPGPAEPLTSRERCYLAGRTRRCVVCRRAQINVTGSMPICMRHAARPRGWS